MNKVIKSSLLTIVLIAVCLIGPIYFVSAETSNTGFTDAFVTGAGFTKTANVNSIVGTVIKAFLSILGMIFLFLMLYAGYTWMMAQGEEAKVTKAKDTMIRAVIGLIIVLGSYALTSFVMTKILG